MFMDEFVFHSSFCGKTFVLCGKTFKRKGLFDEINM